MNKKEALKQIRLEIAQVLNEEKLTHEEIAAQFGVTAKYVGELAKSFKLTRKRGRGSPAWKNKQQRHAV